MRPFKDRSEAGQLLANALSAYVHQENIIVLALPRGGVPVAFEVAKALEAPLDVFLVRKLGVPGHEELAMGAVSSSGPRVLNKSVVEGLQIPLQLIDRVAEREMAEIRRREELYRRGLAPLHVTGKTVILIDDGLATGATMLAAIRAIRTQQPEKLIAAVPVAPASTCEELREETDEMICLTTPEPYFGVGQWYENFSQTSDDEVVAVLHAARAAREGDVRIPCGGVELLGRLSFPEGTPRGVVLFVHGSGSGRNSPRNRYVADALTRSGFCTLLFDLLTAREEMVDLRTRHLRFDVAMLAHRLELVTGWVMEHPRLRRLPVGYFGASTGAAAALMAAAAFGASIRAVVSRGGRPDLAEKDLPQVTSPTLFIVGEWDEPVIVLNQKALAKMRPGLARLEVVPAATHLFEEAGALDVVIDLATRWFDEHLTEAVRVSA